MNKGVSPSGLFHSRKETEKSDRICLRDPPFRIPDQR